MPIHKPSKQAPVPTVVDYSLVELLRDRKLNTEDNSNLNGQDGMVLKRLVAPIL